MVYAIVTWKNSWDEFAKVVCEQLRAHGVPQRVHLDFGSEQITWTGTLQQKSFASYPPTVTIALPSKEIHLGELGTVHISELYVPVAKDSIPHWQEIPEGTSLRFTATLGSGSVYPAVEVKRLTARRALIMIRLIEARPGAEVEEHVHEEVFA